MLNHLFATILICLGVANTTPISNYDQKESNLVLTTPKKTNETTYNIVLQYGNTNSNNYNIPQGQTGNTYYTTATEISTATKISGNNTYLNVKGTAYTDKYYTSVVDEDNNNQNGYFYINYRIIENNLDYHYANKTMMSYMLRIDTYQFNVETTMRIKIAMSILGWSTQSEDFYNYEIYMLKNIYQSTEYQRDPINNQVIYPWDQYIDQQVSQHQPYNIQQDIENVNNGFYYTKEQELEQIGMNDFQGIYIDEIEIQLLPNAANFYYITYTPTTRVVYNQAEITQVSIGNIINTSNTYPISITGTNIIPTSTYEVVDIPGLMFEVIGMPFAFVSQAFNLTLFPGTPYQINIANLFLSIIAIFVFVWLIMLFVKKGG